MKSSALLLIMSVAMAVAHAGEEQPLPALFQVAKWHEIGKGITSLKVVYESALQINGVAARTTVVRAWMTDKCSRIDKSMINAKDGQPILRQSTIYDGDKNYAFDILAKNIYVTKAPHQYGELLMNPPFWALSVMLQFGTERKGDVFLFNVRDRDFLTQAIKTLPVSLESPSVYRVGLRGEKDEYMLVHFGNKRGVDGHLPELFELYAKIIPLDKDGKELPEVVVKGATQVVSETGMVTLSPGQKLEYPKVVTWTSPGTQTIQKVTEFAVNISLDPELFVPDMASAERIQDASALRR